MLTLARRDHAFGERGGSEQLSAIDLIEAIVFATEVAIDVELMELIDGAFDFFFAQHF